MLDKVNSLSNGQKVIALGCSKIKIDPNDVYMPVFQYKFHNLIQLFLLNSLSIFSRDIISHFCPIYSISLYSH